MVVTFLVLLVTSTAFGVVLVRIHRTVYSPLEFQVAKPSSAESSLMLPRQHLLLFGKKRMPLTGVPIPAQRTEYLFIDGGYLTEVLTDFSRRFYPDKTVDVDYKKLGAGFTKIFYYDCEPPQKGDETPEAYGKRLSAYQARSYELSEYPGWHVFEGVTKRQGKRGNVQKEVDVQIAVDLLTHSFRRNMEGVVLMAGDQDFRPVVEAVVREGMYLTLWSDPRHTSKELRHAADARRSFDVYTFNDHLVDGTAKCQLPQRFGQPSPTHPGKLELAP